MRTLVVQRRRRFYRHFRGARPPRPQQLAPGGGCPYQNAGGEVADPNHPINEAGRAQRAWVHETIAKLVKETGAPAHERLTGALIVLYDGAAATALLDGDAASARHARWAAQRMLAS